MKKLIGIFTILVIVFCSACSSKKDSKIPADIKQNKESFIKTLEVFQKANNISSELPNLSGNELYKKEQEITTLIKDGISLSKKVSSEYLRYLHEDMEYNFNNKLVKSNELYLEGYSNKENITNSLSIQLKAHKLLTEWDTYLKKNRESINSNLNKKFTEGKKSYWRMLFSLITADFIATIIFSFILMVLLLPIYLVSLISEKFSEKFALLLYYPFIIITVIGQFYFWIIWASFCAYTVNYHIDSPSVIHLWLYYVTGFFAVSAPIIWFGAKESRLTESDLENKSNQKGTVVYSLFAIIGYVVFCVWPELMDYEIISFLNNWIY